MRDDEREVLERAVQRVTEQAANVNAVVDEALASGLDSLFAVRREPQDAPPRAAEREGRFERELERERVTCVVFGVPGALRRRAGRPRRPLVPRAACTHETPKLPR